MDAFADRTDLVLCLAGFACHPLPPSRYPGAVTATRQIGINPALGLGRRTIDRDVLLVRPLDVLGAAKPAVDDMTLRELAQLLVQLFEHRPHEAAIRAIIA